MQHACSRTIGGSNGPTSFALPNKNPACSRVWVPSVGMALNNATFVLQAKPGTQAANGLTSWEYDSSLPSNLVSAYTGANCDGISTTGVKPNSGTLCQASSSQAQAYILLQGSSGSSGSVYNDNALAVTLDPGYCNC